MKKLVSLSLAITMLLSATACGREEIDDLNDSIDDLIDTAEDIIDPGFSGIVSSGRKYCVGEDASDYRKEIRDEEDFDGEWLIIAEDGNISFFYADDFDEEAESDGRMPKKYKGMTLEEIYEDYISEEQEIEPTEEVTTVPVTTAVTTTTAPATTTQAAAHIPDSAGSVGELKLASGGSTPFTIVSWDSSYENIVKNWISCSGIDEDRVNFINMSCSGYEAAEYINQMFIAGDDIDAYFVEHDWAHTFIDDPSYAAPMSDLGFTENHFANAYPYTITTGTNIYGEFTSPSPIISPGAFAYNTNLAEEYLGVASPEEMQEKIGSWDKFQKSAETVSAATGGKVALADSANGFLFAYSQGKKSAWAANGTLNCDDFCREMAETAKNLWDIGGISHNYQWTDEWTADGEKNKTMGYFVADWSVGGFLLDAASGNYGNWAICQGPAPYYWGGIMTVINPDTDNGDLAQSFIYYSCIDDECMLSLVANYDSYGSSFFVNNAGVMGYAIDNKMINMSYASSDISEMLGGQNYLGEFHKNALEVQLPPAEFSYDATARNLFISELVFEYLEGGDSYDNVVKDVNEEIARY